MTIELPKKDPMEIVSTGEIAEITGITQRGVRMWCEAGKLKAKLLGREYAIHWQDFEAFWQERQTKLNKKETAITNFDKNVTAVSIV